MGQVRIMVIEDEPIIAEDIIACLEDRGYEVSDQFYSGEKALPAIEKDPPDLILLDIMIEGDLDGIQVGKIIRRKFNIPFIFLTSYSDKATIERAKEADPAAYLVKPFDEQDLQPAIEIALHNYAKKQALAEVQQKEEAENSETESNEAEELFIHDTFFVKHKGRFLKVGIQEILWAEAMDNYTYIQTSKEKYLLSSTLKKVENKLHKHAFLRVHRSYLINLEHISSIEDQYLIIHRERIPIGNTYRAELMKRISFL